MTSRMKSDNEPTDQILSSMEKEIKAAWDHRLRMNDKPPQDYAVYIGLRNKHVDLIKQSSNLPRALKFYAELGDVEALTHFIRVASADDVRSSLTDTEMIIRRFSADQKKQLLHVLNERNIRRNSVNIDLGILGSAIEADSPDLFSMGVEWGEISILNVKSYNHQIINAINNCGKACRDHLAGLLMKAVREPEYASSMIETTNLYRVNQVKVLIVLDAFGFALPEDQMHEIETAIASKNISNHARLAIADRRARPKEMLLLHPTHLTFQ